MKPSTAKAKGRATENLLVEHLRAAGWPHAERRRLNGRDDLGDIAGVRGMDGSGRRDICIEVKSGGRIDLAGFLDELRVETRNAAADNGFVAIRPKGKPDPNDWYAVLPLPWLIELLHEAGYAGIPT
jgi:hypothetical protein